MKRTASYLILLFSLATPLLSCGQSPSISGRWQLVYFHDTLEYTGNLIRQPVTDVKLSFNDSDSAGIVKGYYGGHFLCNNADGSYTLLKNNVVGLI